MAISLNNHESRISVLENRTSTSFESNKSDNGYVKLGNIILQWGSRVNNQNTTINFAIKFPNKCFTVVCGPEFPSYAESDFSMVIWNSVTTTGFKIPYYGKSDYKVRWLAIGYLISNRILNRVYAYVKSLRDFKAIIKSHFFCCISNISREVI